jgi:hypothetical protein
MKHKVIYFVKNEKNILIEKIKVFPSSDAANAYFQEVKKISVSKPILERI